jgi:hypothetical protein
MIDPGETIRSSTAFDIDRHDALFVSSLLVADLVFTRK